MRAIVHVVVRSCGRVCVCVVLCYYKLFSCVSIHIWAYIQYVESDWSFVFVAAGLWLQFQPSTTMMHLHRTASYVEAGILCSLPTMFQK